MERPMLSWLSQPDGRACATSTMVTSATVMATPLQPSSCVAEGHTPNPPPLTRPKNARRSAPLLLLLLGRLILGARQRAREPIVVPRSRRRRLGRLGRLVGRRLPLAKRAHNQQQQQQQQRAAAGRLDHLQPRLIVRRLRAQRAHLAEDGVDKRVLVLVVVKGLELKVVVRERRLLRQRKVEEDGALLARAERIAVLARGEGRHLRPVRRRHAARDGAHVEHLRTHVGERHEQVVLRADRHLVVDEVD
mmetsp:Transcript_23972/g.64294  ORF Transcript_23972/g.64294 Transcript_23972/m.64294 type:complete len:248 (+) Transcript_23972:170-913(+)